MIFLIHKDEFSFGFYSGFNSAINPSESNTDNDEVRNMQNLTDFN